MRKARGTTNTMTDLPTYTPSEVLAATFIIRNLLGANGDLWRYILDKTLVS